MRGRRREPLAILLERCSSSVKYFADCWPSSSPNLNPLVYAVWGVVEQANNKYRHLNDDSLKEAIRRVWHKMPANFVIDSSLRFYKRLEAVTANNGGHIE